MLGLGGPEGLRAPAGPDPIPVPRSGHAKHTKGLRALATTTSNPERSVSPTMAHKPGGVLPRPDGDLHEAGSRSALEWGHLDLGRGHRAEAAAAHHLPGEAEVEQVGQRRPRA